MRAILRAAIASLLRSLFERGERGLFNPLSELADGVRDWAFATAYIATVLAPAGYGHPCVFARNSGYVDQPAVLRTLAKAPE